MKDRRLAGIGYMTFGISSFATMDAIGKWLVRDFSVFQLLALRSTLVTIVLVGMLPFLGGRQAIRSAQIGAHCVRSAFGALAFVFFFVSVRYLPLADAVAVAFGGPFIVTALSVPLLGEHVDGRRWLAIVIGFLGMLLIVQPTGAGFRPAALLVIAASVSYALLMVMTRWMARRSRGEEKTTAFLFYTFAFQAVVGSLVVMAQPGQWRPMTPFEMLLICGMGALSLIGQFGITRAFQLAPASVVVPMEYTALIWSTTLGYVVFGDFPGLEVWLGVLVIVGAGLYTVHREAEA